MLPTFEEMRRNAFRLLGAAEDELRSDWAFNGAPSREQNEARQDALRRIAEAKTALDRAAR